MDFDDMEHGDFDDMEHGDVQSTVKVLVIGNGHVGKSTYVKRFLYGNYDDTYKKTVGAVYSERREFCLPALNNKTVDINVWDTAGQEEYRTLNHKYYGGAGCALLLFSTTDANSFHELPSWKAKVLELCGDVPMAIVQTKVDALEHASMTEDEVNMRAQQLQLRVFRSSSAQGVNIEEPFEYVAALCLNKGGGDSDQQLSHIISLSKTTEQRGGSEGSGNSGSGGGSSNSSSNSISGGGSGEKSSSSNNSSNGHKDQNVAEQNKVEEKNTSGKTTTMANIPPASRVYSNRPTQPSRRRTDGKKEARCSVS
jgi:small GTP-binding protein